LFEQQAVVQRAVETLINRGLRQRQRMARARCELLGPFNGRCCHICVVGATVHEAYPFSLNGVDHSTSEHQVLRPSGTDKASEALRAAATGNDAEQDFGLTEFGFLSGQTEVTRQCEFAPATERHSRHCGNGWAWQRSHCVQRTQERAADLSNPRRGSEGKRLCSPALGEFGDVSASRKHLRPTGNDNGPRWFCRKFFASLSEPIQQVHAQRVHLAVAQCEHDHAVIMAIYKYVRNNLSHDATLSKGAPETPPRSVPSANIGNIEGLRWRPGFRLVSESCNYGVGQTFRNNFSEPNEFTIEARRA